MVLLGYMQTTTQMLFLRNIKNNNISTAVSTAVLLPLRKIPDYGPVVLLLLVAFAREIRRSQSTIKQLHILKIKYNYKNLNKKILSNCFLCAEGRSLGNHKHCWQGHPLRPINRYILLISWSCKFIYIMVIQWQFPQQIRCTHIL